MKRFPKRIAILAMLFLLANSMKAFISNAEELPEAPAFHACIEYSSQGYVVKSSFTEIPPDIYMVQYLYSLDGETYQACSNTLKMQGLDMAEMLARLQNQICLYSNQEPLKSYLDKKLDRFYLKLRLTLNNEATYDTQTTLIDRGRPQPIPEELHPEAVFASSMAVSEMRPLCRYGRYHLTVREDTSAEDIASFLPDTLPIEIRLTNDLQFTNGIVDCPVTWKHLSLPDLAAGESVTINDVAEEIVVPEGTLVNTPTGIFRLEEPLKLSDQYGWTDEVRLVLNVIADDENPTGTLFEENDGLNMTFHLKPTGAAAIRAYTLPKGETEWTEIPGLSLLNAVNSQPSTANSSYALVLDKTREPYQSYCAAVDAKETPEPFLVGLKIEGGTYDGRQLVLAWPETYEPPMNLPNMDGSGGNEANAGADNKNDSTPEGQRPNLPQTSEDNNNAIESQENPPHNLQNTVIKKISPRKTDVSPKINPAHGNQLQDLDNMFHNPGLYIQQLLPNTSTAKNPPAETDAKNDTWPEAAAGSEYNAWPEAAAGSKYNAWSEAAVDPEYDVPIDTSVLAPSGQNGNTDVKETSAVLEIPERSAANENLRIFLPLAAIAAVIIGIAAAAHKMAAGRKSGRTSSILQKLQHKRRTLPQR